MSSPQGSLFPRLRSCGADGDLEAQFLLKCLEDHGPAVELTPSGAALSAFLLDIIDAVTNSSPGSHELLYLVIELFSLEWSPRMIHPATCLGSSVALLSCIFSELTESRGSVPMAPLLRTLLAALLRHSSVAIAVVMKTDSMCSYLFDGPDEIAMESLLQAATSNLRADAFTYEVILNMKRNGVFRRLIESLGHKGASPSKMLVVLCLLLCRCRDAGGLSDGDSSSSARLVEEIFGECFSSASLLLIAQALGQVAAEDHVAAMEALACLIFIRCPGIYITNVLKSVSWSSTRYFESAAVQDCSFLSTENADVKALDVVTMLQEGGSRGQISGRLLLTGAINVLLDMLHPTGSDVTHPLLHESPEPAPLLTMGLLTATVASIVDETARARHFDSLIMLFQGLMVGPDPVLLSSTYLKVICGSVVTACRYHSYRCGQQATDTGSLFLWLQTASNLIFRYMVHTSRSCPDEHRAIFDDFYIALLVNEDERGLDQLTSPLQDSEQAESDSTLFCYFLSRFLQSLSISSETKWIDNVVGVRRLSLIVSLSLLKRRALVDLVMQSDFLPLLQEVFSKAEAPAALSSVGELWLVVMSILSVDMKDQFSKKDADDKLTTSAASALKCVEAMLAALGLSYAADLIALKELIRADPSQQAHDALLMTSRLSDTARKFEFVSQGIDSSIFNSPLIGFVALRHRFHGMIKSTIDAHVTEVVHRVMNGSPHVQEDRCLPDYDVLIDCGSLKGINDFYVPFSSLSSPPGQRAFWMCALHVQCLLDRVSFLELKEVLYLSEDLSSETISQLAVLNNQMLNLICQLCGSSVTDRASSINWNQRNLTHLLKLIRSTCDFELSCDPRQESIVCDLFIDFVAHEVNACRSNDCADHFKSALLPSALELCAHAIATTLHPAGRMALKRSIGSILKHWLRHVETLLDSYLLYNYDRSIWSSVCFHELMCRYGLDSSLLSLFQSLFPVVKTDAFTLLPFDPELIKSELLVCFDKTLRAVVLFSKDIRVSPALFKTFMTSSLETILTKEEASLAVMEAMVEMLSGLPAFQAEDAAEVPPPRGGFLGNPSSFAFSADTPEAMLSVTGLTRHNLSSNHSAPRGWVKELTEREAAKLQAAFWSPLICPFSFCGWFKINQSECCGGGLACPPFVLCSLRNEYEQLSVTIQHDKVVVSLSLSIEVPSADTFNRTDVVGLDLEFDRFGGVAGINRNVWNHLCVVQRKKKVSNSDHVDTLMSLTAYLNGSPSKVSDVTLPPLSSFKYYKTHPLDLSMEYTFSAGFEAAESKVDCDKSVEVVEVSSLLLLDSSLNESEILAVVSCGPAHKHVDVVGAAAPRACFIDFSVCPLFFLKRVVAADILTSPLSKFERAAVNTSPRKRKESSAKAINFTNDSSALIARDRPTSVEISYLEKHVILALSNCWSQSICPQFAQMATKECDRVCRATATENEAARCGNLARAVSDDILHHRGLVESPFTLFCPAAGVRRVSSKVGQFLKHVDVMLQGQGVIYFQSHSPSVGAEGSFLLLPSSIMCLLTELVSCASTGTLLYLSLRLLSLVLASIPECRVAFSQSMDVLSVLALIKEKVSASTIELNRDSALCLLGLVGCSVGYQQQRCLLTPSWHTFAIIDPYFLGDVLADFKLWGSAPLAVYKCLLETAARAFYLYDSSIDTHDWFLVSQFNANKIQLNKSGMVRSLLQGLLDRSQLISMEYVHTVVSFLCKHFSSDDGNFRSAAVEDDYFAVWTALNSIWSSVYHSNVHAKVEDVLADLELHERYFCIGYALTGLLLQLATVITMRFRSLRLNSASDNDLDCQFIQMSTASTKISDESTVSPYDSSNIDDVLDEAAVMVNSDPGVDLMNVPSSLSGNRASPLVGDGRLSTGSVDKPHGAPRAEKEDKTALINIMSENCVKTVKSFITIFPLQRIFYLISEICRPPKQLPTSQSERNIVLNLLCFVCSLSPQLPLVVEQDSLVAFYKELAVYAALMAWSCVCYAGADPIPAPNMEPSCSVWYSEGMLPFLTAGALSLKGEGTKKKTYKFAEMNLGSLLRRDMRVCEEAAYFDNFEDIMLFGYSALSVSGLTSYLIEIIIDVLLCGQGSLRHAVIQVTEGWNFDDVEPVYRFATTVPPRAGFRTAFATIQTGSFDQITDERMCLGLDEMQIRELPFRDKASGGLELRALQVIVSVLRAVSTSTTIAGIMFLHDEVVEQIVGSPSGNYLQPLATSSSGYEYCMSGEVFELFSRKCRTAVELCVSLLSMLCGLWSRYPEFQCSLLSESGLPFLQVLVEGVVRLFCDVSRAKMMEVLFLEAVRVVSVPDFATDNFNLIGTEAIFPTVVKITGVSLYSQLIRTFSELLDSNAVFSNLLLYRSGGSLVGRMCLQLLTCIGDSFFLSEMPSDCLSGSSSFGSLREPFGHATFRFVEVFEKGLTTSTPFSSHNDTSKFGKFPQVVHTAFLLLLNSAVRRRMFTAAAPRLVGLVEHRLSQAAPLMSKTDWKKCMRNLSYLSSLALVIISVETELSRRTTGSELNFDSRVISVLCYLRDVVYAMQAASARLEETSAHVKQSNPEQDSDQVSDADRISSVPSSYTLKSGIGATMTTLFRRKSNTTTSSTPSSGASLAQSVDAPQPRTSAVAFSGLVGNMLKKGIKNISTVSEGIAKFGTGRTAPTSDEDLTNVGLIIGKSVTLLRQMLIAILECYRKSPTVLSKILPMLLDSMDLFLTPVTHTSTSVEKSIFNTSNKEEDFETSFFSSLCVMLLHIFCHSSGNVSYLAAVCWGSLFLHPSDSVVSSLRQLLVVEMNSPNDSTIRMKLDTWNYDGRGVCQLYKIATLVRDGRAANSAVELLDVIATVSESIVSFKEWFLATPENLREALSKGMHRIAKTCMKSTKSLIDTTIKSHTDKFETVESVVTKFDDKKFSETIFRVRQKASVEAHVLESKALAQVAQQRHNNIMIGLRRANEMTKAVQAAATVELMSVNDIFFGLWWQDPLSCVANAGFHFTIPRLPASSAPWALEEENFGLCHKCRYRSFCSGQTSLSWSRFISLILGHEVQANRRMNMLPPSIDSGECLCCCGVLKNVAQKDHGDGPSQISVGIASVMTNITLSRNAEFGPGIPASCCGEWAVDITEGCYRMRSRLRRSPLAILSLRERDSVAQLYLTPKRDDLKNASWDVSSPLSEAKLSENSLHQTNLISFIGTGGTVEPNEHYDNFEEVDDYLSDYGDVPPDEELNHRDPETKYPRTQRGMSRMAALIFKSPARSFSVHDWECLEAGSTAVLQGSLETSENASHDSKDVNFSHSNANNRTVHNPLVEKVEIEINSSVAAAEGMTVELGQAEFGRITSDDHLLGDSLGSKIGVSVMVEHQELVSVPLHAEPDAQFPLPHGEIVQKNFVCNLVLGMEYLPCRCTITNKNIYIFGCEIDNEGHLRYLKGEATSDTEKHFKASRYENDESNVATPVVVPSTKYSAPVQTPNPRKLMLAEIPKRANLSSMLVSAMLTMLKTGMPSLCGGKLDVVVSFRDVMGIHRRRYLLSHKAVELFLISGRSLFLAFPSVALRNAFCGEILKRCSHILALDLCVTAESDDDQFVTTPLGMTPLSAYWFHKSHQNRIEAAAGVSILSASRALAASKPLHLQSLELATERWVSGEMSNFEYLMTLNTYSGRSYNDWTQYPVFPWVLRDYSSSVLNLDDLNVYRDLSKPMGALHSVREAEARKKYALLRDQANARSSQLMGDGVIDQVTGEEVDLPEVHPFHFGTHYSSAAAVLYYMVRMQPFSSHAIALQGGKKFDKPDRIFQSIEKSWLSASGGLSSNPESATSNLQDVKELIPEFYYFPDFLVNMNGYPFGNNSDGRAVGDVELPPWANGSPLEFIRLHRAALESRHVTDNLHKWIDLIFGYKQRGAKAVKACNVFHHMSYEGGTDVDTISSREERDACLQTIRDFGQIPAQIFQSPHPRCKRSRNNQAASSIDINQNSPEDLLLLDLDFSDAENVASHHESVPISKVSELQLAGMYCANLAMYFDSIGPRERAGTALDAQSVVLDRLACVSSGDAGDPTAEASESTIGGSGALSVVRPSDYHRLSRATTVFPCPPNSLFVPLFDAAAPGETRDSGLLCRSASVMFGLMAVWGYSDCTIRLFVNKAYGRALNYSDGRAHTQTADVHIPVSPAPKTSSARHSIGNASDWVHLKSVRYPDITVSCAASSNSGRLMFTGHALCPMIHKWRLYPSQALAVNKGASRHLDTGDATKLMDCGLLLVEAISCPAHVGSIASIVLSVCSGSLVTICQGGNIVLWSLMSLQQIRLFSSLSSDIRGDCMGTTRVPLQNCRCIAVDPAAGHIFHGFYDVVVVYDDNGRCLGKTLPRGDGVFALCVCPLRDVAVDLIDKTSFTADKACSSKMLNRLFAVGYSNGSVLMWRLNVDSGGLRSGPGASTESRGAETCSGLPWSLVVHNYTTIPSGLPVKSLCAAKHRSRLAVRSTAECTVEVLAGTADGAVYLWECGV